MREKLIHELEEERRLRLDSEKRLREVTEESELGQAQMVSLQQHFSRMEETVRTLLQNQGVLEQTAVDTVDLMKAYKEKLSEEVLKHRGSLEQSRRSPLASEPAQVPVDATPVGEEDDKTKLLLERLQTLEEKNSALAIENETQREQYECCLDEVANQVVQALLTQKDLREECLKLRTRVFDLEQQNRTLSVLFQQKVRPASDLLLQKLHSRIMDLSAADLLLDPERSKGFLITRNTNSPTHEVLLNGKSGLPVAKCLSQLSLTVPGPVYGPRSSCSSSELSLSSACSEYSSGSFTWNDGRSCGKMSSLTREKRLSLGSSAPSNICTPLEEQFPTRRKESHILEGLRKLQRPKPKSSSTSRVSKSGNDKDCMNSNEGIYSLGIKSGGKERSKAAFVGRRPDPPVWFGGRRQLSYDSDDADDESAHSSQRDNVPNRDNWLYCKQLSHSISDSLCSWEGLQDNGKGFEASTNPEATQPLPGFNAKDRPEKLMSFLNSFLSSGRTSAFVKPSLLHFEVSPTEPDCPPLKLSDTDDPNDALSETAETRTAVSLPAQKDPQRLSHDSSKLQKVQCLRRDQGRTQSADGRPSSFSLLQGEHKGTQSEESIPAIFDVDGVPIELCAQLITSSIGARKDIPGCTVGIECAELASQERPIRLRGVNSTRNYKVLASPEKPCEYQSQGNRPGRSKHGSTERLTAHVTPQRNLIKPPSNRANKVQSIPPTVDGAKTAGSRIPSRKSSSCSPLRVSKVPAMEPGHCNKSGPALDKLPSSPPVKISRFIKTPTGSPKAVALYKPHSEWASAPPSGSPHLPRRLQEHVDYGEQPTRDRHCEPNSKTDLRSPSPPPPPGRTTSLLIRPNYDGSPQALKTGVQSTTTITTVRGPPPSYHPPSVPNMPNTLPCKGQPHADLDAGYGTAIAPQKLVDKASQHLQKSPWMTPSKGNSNWGTTKHYLPSANAGCVTEHPENVIKGSKNCPPPYSALRGSSLQSTFACKRGLIHGNNPAMHKNSTSLPISLQGESKQCIASPQESKIASPQSGANPLTSIVLAPAEKASKTRIPMGFKAFVKSPPSHKSSPVTPGKHEKEQINSVSRETVTTNSSTQCKSLQQVYNIDSRQRVSIAESPDKVTQGRSLGGDVPADTLTEERKLDEQVDVDAPLFKRSISVTTKPHLKPALGMNGAKARSQSFSTNYMEKPNISGSEGPGKIVRTQIITNSGERGNSLTRQSSFVEGLQTRPNSGQAESPVHCPSKRLSLYAALTGSNSPPILPENPPRSDTQGQRQLMAKAEGTEPLPLKEAQSLPSTDQLGTKNYRKPAKVLSHPQLQHPTSSIYSSPETAQNQIQAPIGKVVGNSKVEQSQGDFTATPGSPDGLLEEKEKQASPTACTIEEKVMMGIEQNIQKGQGLDKVVGSEGKLKTGPSLANWFGLRKSKLPAFYGKKTDSPKGKEEKKELKIGSVLSGKATKTDKKKDKKKIDFQEQTVSDSNSKLSSIMDQCNIQMGQIANQIHCSTAYIGKDQFMKELLGRTAAVKGDIVAPSSPGISIPKKHSELKNEMEICNDTTLTTIIMTQKMNLKCEKQEGLVPDATNQDHVIGSSCQMRTLDSGIGTFPPPDSVTRRHIPKSESSPDWVAAGSTGELAPNYHNSGHHLHPSSPPKVPSLPADSHLRSPGSGPHSLCNPTVPGNHIFGNQSHLPKPAPMGKHDKALQMCKYSGSNSDTETEQESARSTLSSPQNTLNMAKNCSQDQEAETLRRSSVRRSLSIMDYYQHDVFSHLEKNARRRHSQYSTPHKESSPDSKSADRPSKALQLEQQTPVSSKVQTCSLDVSLEALNKLNHSCSSGSGLYPETDLRSGGSECPEGGTSGAN
ncbi:nck-associated protein 5-like [Aplochiton taeniatus]